VELGGWVGVMMVWVMILLLVFHTAGGGAAEGDGGEGPGQRCRLLRLPHDGLREVRAPRSGKIERRMIDDHHHHDHDGLREVRTPRSGVYAGHCDNQSCTMIRGDWEVNAHNRSSFLPSFLSLSLTP
jgi:hypothetical protein